MRAILLLCGSGEQDRDRDIDGDGRYRMGAMLAEALNRSGIAVLRLDDRGTGGSSGVRESLTSFEVLKRDALTAIAFLRRHKDVAEVGVGGFSSEAAIAVMAAADFQAVDFLIAFSGPFVSGVDILMAQAEAFPEVFVPQPSEDRQDLLRQARRFQSLCVAAARGEDTGIGGSSPRKHPLYTQWAAGGGARENHRPRGRGREARKWDAARKGAGRTVRSLPSARHEVDLSSPPRGGSERAES